MKTMKIAIVLFALLLPGPAALAQRAAAPSAAAVDAKAQELAVELVKQMHLRDYLKSSFAALSQNIGQIAGRENPAKMESIQKVISAGIEKVFLARAPEFEKNAAKVYAQTFSADELRQIIDFYKTPVGQKTVTLMPEMMRKAASSNMPVVNAAMEESMRAIVKELKTKGYKLPKELSM